MATTLTAFVDAIEALTVTGVVKTFQGPPSSLSSAQLPSAWVQSATMVGMPVTRGNSGGWPTLKCELVIALEAVSQSMQDDNFVAAVAMVDTLTTALNSAALAKVMASYEVRTAIVEVAGAAYWAVIAAIEASG